jgi:hypothetical protein
MTEQETKDRQRRAYENRDSILPRDVLYMTCSDANTQFAMFEMPGDTLTIRQSGKEIIRKGERVKITCTSQIIKANGYGLFVDYEFTVYETGGTVIINGPDAQSLVRTVKPVKIANRDIPLLREVLSVMQSVYHTEQLHEWQRERMVKITASLSGMPGGGGRKGLDDAVSVLDELNQNQIRECKEYAHALRRAQRVLNGIESRNMRAFVMLKYVMGVTDAEIRRELNLTRRGFERAVRAIQDAPDMASVKWQERYILEDHTKY